MIYKLRRKFIRICSLSFLVALLVILLATYIISHVKTNQAIDILADMVSKYDGNFPEFDRMNPNPDLDPRPEHNIWMRPNMPDIINSEVRFTTRFFIVFFDDDGNVLKTDIDSILSVTSEQAIEYAKTAFEKGEERGGISNYRYKLYDTDDGKAVAFVDGSMQQAMSGTMIITIATVFVACSLFILILIVIISKRVVKPIAESYEKQRQFVTDANHELKTPLTLILANVDIAESEVGENEWLADIRSEGERMSVLISQLGDLAQMDEQKADAEKSKFSLSDAVADTVSGFEALAKQKNIILLTEITSRMDYTGNEAQIRQLIAILMDNAVKYCDSSGRIAVGLETKKRPILWVENSFSKVKNTELSKLFDRFFRAEKARTAGNSFGIGLSIAKSIVEKHGGEISAHNIGNSSIRFVVKL